MEKMMTNWNNTKFDKYTIPDNRPKSAGKSWAASATTALSLMAAFWGYGEPPTDVAVSEALTELGIAIVGGAVSWVVTYYKHNYLKPTV